MPKIGMEPIRRSALVAAAIDEIGKAGTLHVTVSQIARRAGVSSALAHHYFGSKEQILIAAMRHILSVFGAEVRSALRRAETPRERADAIIAACFSADSLRAEVASAWLNFYVLAQSSDEAKRLLTIYRRRLRSNLIHALQPMARDRSPAIASSTGALIDGIYLRRVLRRDVPDMSGCIAMVTDHLEHALGVESARFRSRAL